MAMPPPYEIPWFAPAGISWMAVAVRLRQIRSASLAATLIGRAAVWCHVPSASISKMTVTSVIPAERAARKLGWEVRGRLPFGGLALDAQGIPLLWVNRSDYAAPLYHMLGQHLHTHLSDLPIPNLTLLAAIKLCSVSGPRSKDVDDVIQWIERGLIDPDTIRHHVERARPCIARHRVMGVITSSTTVGIAI